MKIESIEAVPLRVPHDENLVDCMHETLIVIVTTDDGIVGVGEAAASPLACQAFLNEPNSWAWSRGVRDILLGRELNDPRALWSDVYYENYWSGRCGIGHAAMAGVDMALWDIAGKAAGVPVWQLLDGRRPTLPTPYITMYTGAGSLDETTERTNAVVDDVKRRGFRAAKIEALPDTTADNVEVIELTRRVREHAGPELTLLCDVAYRWKSAEEGIECMRELDRYDLFLLEAPFFPDDLESYRRLAEAVETPIAGAEILTSYAEFVHLMDYGGANIVQPYSARIGITDLDRLARAAAEREKQVVTFGWAATTISITANIHVAAANDSVALVEYVPPWVALNSVLRAELAGPEPVTTDGMFELPTEPGLGVTVDLATLERYRVDSGART